MTWLPNLHSSADSQSEIRKKTIRSEMKQLKGNKNSTLLQQEEDREGKILRNKT